MWTIWGQMASERRFPALLTGADGTNKLAFERAARSGGTIHFRLCGYMRRAERALT
jgi:hypothetical protein